MDSRQYIFNKSTLTVKFGNILESQAEVIVSPDDSPVSMGGGVSSAILKAGGMSIMSDAQKMIPVAPVLAHGLSDDILFCMNVDEGLAVICLFLFLYFFNKLRKRGKERIESLMNQ